MIDRQHHQQLQNNDDDEEEQEQEFRVVIIGSGWAGLSAADVLCQHENSMMNYRHIRIDLLDASAQVGGLASGWKSNTTTKTTTTITTKQQSVEGGLHGFWREYRNTFATIQRICDSMTTSKHNKDHNGKTLRSTTTTIDDLLTPYTPSVLYCQSGRVALAPVMGAEYDDDEKDDNLTVPKFDDVMRMILMSSSSTLADQKASLRLLSTFLPAPLDIAIGSEFASDSKLTLTDRISALNLLSIWANFDPARPSSWDRYDDISADTLFRGSARVSETLYEELVVPLLSVLPMCPGYDCSAAAAISCFHTFALCRKGAFDVRWCRGTITETIFHPWIQLLQQDSNVNNFHIRNNAKVTSITEIDDTKNQYVISINDNNDTITCDAIIFAVGIGGAQKLLSASPPLQSLPVTAKWNQLRAISCLCVRLFLNTSHPFVQELLHDKMKDSPVAVCGPNVLLPELCETGFCIYDLHRLQDEFKNSDTTTIEVDYYRATDAVINLPNADITDLTLRAIANVLNITIPSHNCVVDVSVIRARNAVSHFSVGSASCTPESVKLRHGLYICGDWIDRKGHASWSTEKAVVTGRQAASALASDFHIALSKSAQRVIPAAPDTPQLATLRKVNTALTCIR